MTTPFPPLSSHEAPPPQARTAGEAEAEGMAPLPGQRPSQRDGTLWLRMLRWIQGNTFAPEWLPAPLRHPLIGYLAALLIEGLAAILLLLLLTLFPLFAFQGIFALGGMLLVALGWGAGPGLFASLVTTILLYVVVFPPRFSLTLTNPADGFGLLIYLVVGASISVLAGQNEQARRQAKETTQLLAQAEIRSRVNAERLRTVLEVLPAAVLIINPEGRVLDLNRVAKTLWGGDIPLGTDLTQYSQDNQFKAWWAKTGQPLPPEEWPLIRALTSGEAVLNEEIEIETLDGQRKVILNSVVPLRDTTGAMTGAVISAQDISELRRLEHEMSGQAQELEAIFETITDGITVLDAQGKLVRTNRAFRILSGTEQHPEYATLPMDQRLSALAMRDVQGRPLPMEEWPATRMLRGETLVGVDIAMNTLDGRMLVLSLSGAPIRDERGQVTGCVGVFRDMTGRYQLERRTRETLDTLVAMAEAMVHDRPSTLGVEVADEASVATQIAIPTAATLRVVATRLAEMTRTLLECRRVCIAAVDATTGQLSPVTEVGLPAELAQAWWASWSPAQSLEERYGPAIAAALNAGEPALLDTQHLPERSWYTLFQAQSGRIVPMQLGEELVGILLMDYEEFDHDYSKEDEILLTKTLARLGALVLERDRLLRGWAEARANELALSEAKAQMDTFLAIASHELKTPLTSLKLSLQTTERRLRKLTTGKMGGEAAGEPEEPVAVSAEKLRDATEHLSRMDRQIKRLEQLVNDLLDVSRIQAGKLELRPEPVDLVAIVREVIDEQQEAAPDRSIQFHAAADQAARLYADKGRIEQVVTNYVSNALKYSAEDRPVEVGVEVEPQQARVWVRDQGPGLDRSEQERIWERFHRAKGVEVQSGSGVGLGVGLYISRMIVERHHGQVGVESIPGSGSTFWFTLPLLYSEEEGQ
jgi:signal transduction histidine kinase